MATKFVGYYRVSTREQGKSGLGLEAQASAVKAYLGSSEELEGEFTEVESGAATDRPQLAAALQLCRRSKAKLLIARLDRLARNVRFISQLMESGVDFIAVDMPTANKLTIHIIAAIAEHERDIISQRTKAALSAAKIRGTRLGNPRISEIQHLGTRRRIDRADVFAKRTYPMIRAIQSSGATSYAAIASALNVAAVPTQQGKSWTPAGVRNIVMRSTREDQQLAR